MSQPITLNLPEPFYQHIKQQAEKTQRTMEAELLEVVATTMPEEERLPADLANAIAALNLLDDKTLWQAARTHLSVKAVSRMERLHNIRRNVGLNEAEKEELAALVSEYEKSILIRSEAMGILMERGHDVSKLVKKRA